MSQDHLRGPVSQNSILSSRISNTFARSKFPKMRVFGNHFKLESF